MSLEVTSIVLGVAVALGLAANLMSRRRLEPGRVRLVPYTAIQFLCLAVAVVMLAHLISLLTGTPLPGRVGF
ncbi:MAG: hypothetical protein R3316_11165 [Rhodovibrionaceae bacterium]|nr:hypothetical protein [Rhodovibrionaceae bacterium]